MAHYQNGREVDRVEIWVLRPVNASCVAVPELRVLNKTTQYETSLAVVAVKSAMVRNMTAYFQASGYTAARSISIRGLNPCDDYVVKLFYYLPSPSTWRIAVYGDSATVLTATETVTTTVTATKVVTSTVTVEKTTTATVEKTTTVTITETRVKEHTATVTHRHGRRGGWKGRLQMRRLGFSRSGNARGVFDNFYNRRKEETCIGGTARGGHGRPLEDV